MSTAHAAVGLPAREEAPLGLGPEARDSVKCLMDQATRDVAVLSGLEGTGAVRAFEEDFASSVGARYAVATSSGTSALLAALTACGVAPGAEVIVSTYGWGGTAGAVLALGARPIFADIEPVRLSLCPSQAERLCGERTGAILATHFLGLPGDLQGLTEVAKRHRVPLIFDAAQGLGATYDGTPIGFFGDVSIFSFGRGKLLSTGEGGMAVTQDEHLFERLVLASQHPIRALRDVADPSLRAFVDEVSLSCRMHPVAAAIGRAELPHLEGRLARRRATCLAVQETLGDVAGLEVVGDVMPATNAFHQLALTYTGLPRVPRQRLIDALHRNGVPVVPGPVRVPLHRRGRFQGNVVPGEAPPLGTSRSRTHAPMAEQRCASEELVIESPSRWTNVSSASLMALSTAIKRAVGEVVESSSPDGAGT